MRPWLTAAATALLVVQPLLPSESAARHGDGIAIVMLWLAVFVAWTLAAIGRPRFALRCVWADAAVLALVAWHTVAAVLAAGRAAPRPAVNTLWQWIAFGLAMFCVRQFFAGPRQCRALLAVMIGLCVAISCYGLYQSLVELPQTRAAYAADPNGTLRDAGLWYSPGSPERDLFERRLANTEPLSTFALTNSLAGLLAPWLVVLACVALPAARKNRAVAVGAVFAAVLIGTCLALTKSRSAYVAVACGLLAGWLLGRRPRSGVLGATAGLPAVPQDARFGLRTRPLLFAALAIVAVAGIATATLGNSLLAGARKSLGYRLEYWQGAAAMIAEQPVFGCGPGNFQNAYTRHKLPAASEEVADPHNFLLEVWATAGSGAAVALLAALALFAVAVWRGQTESAPNNASPLPRAGEGQGVRAVRHKSRSYCWTPPNDSAVPKSLDDRGDSPRCVFLGAAAGGALFVPLSLLSAAPPNALAVLVALLPGTAVVGLLWPWIARGTLPAAVPTVGVITLLMHLSASGGIGFPGVAETLWLLLAVGLNLAQPGPRPNAPSPEERWPRGLALAALAGGMALAAACYLTAYSPVLGCQGKLRAAQRALAEGRTDAAVAAAQAAAAADPLSAEPWRLLAGTAMQAWRRAPSDAAYQAIEQSLGELLRLSGDAFPVWQAAGDMYLEVSVRAGDDGRPLRPEAAREAVRCHRRAVELYPNSPTARAKLAIALRAVGDAAAFAAQRDEALRLDALTPHADKKLPAELRRALE